MALSPVTGDRFTRHRNFDHEFSLYLPSEVLLYILLAKVSNLRAKMRAATTAEKKALVKDLFGSIAEERLDSFSAYFRVYDLLTNPRYATVQIYPPVINSHDGIRKLVLELRANPQSTRKEFRDRVFTSCLSEHSTAADQEIAINFVIQVMLMIDCADKDRHWEGYEIGGFKPVCWEDSKSFADFVRGVFPLKIQDNEKVRKALREKNTLKCWKLRKRAHVKFLPTNNLAEHLLYDPADNAIRIFHQTAFIKAHLRLSASMPLDSGISECLKM